MDLNSSPAKAAVLGYCPLVGLVEEHLGIGDVIAQVHFRLDREQTVGVADVGLELRGHLVKVQEQFREGSAVHLQQRIVGVHDIDGHLATEGIDHRLDAIADVIETAARKCRVGVTVGRRERILQPPQLPRAIHHRVRVFIHGQKRRQRLDPAADLTPVLDLGAGGYLVAEQYVDIGELPGVSQPPEGATQVHPALSPVMQVTARRIDLGGQAVHDGEGRWGFAVVNLRPFYWNLTADWDVLYEKLRASLFRGKADGRTHDDAEAVGVLEPTVYPVSGVCRQVFWVQFPRC